MLLRKRCNVYCVKSVQIWSFFWSVFSRIRTEHGASISQYSNRMQENKDQKISVFGHFSRSGADFFKFPVTTIETELDYYQQKVNVLISSNAAKSTLTLKSKEIRKFEENLSNAWN